MLGGSTRILGKSLGPEIFCEKFNGWIPQHDAMFQAGDTGVSGWKLLVCYSPIYGEIISPFTKIIPGGHPSNNN